MDTEDASVMASHDERRIKDQQVDNAIRAIQHKKPLPEIDFTIHTMEDGTQVSTMERVVKGMSCRSARLSALSS
jgi:serine/threonine-protein phosphatase 2B catalytic subunit